MFSAVSIWEIAIKSGLGRPGFDLSARMITTAARQTGFEEAPVTAEIAMAVADLPKHHRDPFDHLLLAQAIVSGAELLTVDAALLGYDGPIRRA